MNGKAAQNLTTKVADGVPLAADNGNEPRLRSCERPRSRGKAAYRGRVGVALGAIPIVKIAVNLPRDKIKLSSAKETLALQRVPDLLGRVDEQFDLRRDAVKSIAVGRARCRVLIRLDNLLGVRAQTRQRARVLYFH